MFLLFLIVCGKPAFRVAVVEEDAALDKLDSVRSSMFHADMVRLEVTTHSRPFLQSARQSLWLLIQAGPDADQSRWLDGVQLGPGTGKSYD